MVGLRERCGGVDFDVGGLVEGGEGADGEEM